MLGDRAVQNVTRVWLGVCAPINCASKCDIDVDVEQMIGGGDFNMCGVSECVGHEAEVVTDCGIARVGLTKGSDRFALDSA